MHEKQLNLFDNKSNPIFFIIYAKLGDSLFSLD